MSTALAEKNTAEQAVYDSLPTPADGWATPKAVAEVTELAVSTVRKQLNRLAEAGRVESSSDPEVTGAKGTLWRQTGEPASAERVAEAFAEVEAEEAFEPPIGAGAEPVKPADERRADAVERLNDVAVEGVGDPAGWLSDNDGNEPAQEAADEPEPAEVDDTPAEPETAASGDEVPAGERSQWYCVNGHHWPIPDTGPAICPECGQGGHFTPEAAAASAADGPADDRVAREAEAAERVHVADFGDYMEAYDRPADADGARVIGTAVKGGKRDNWKGWSVRAGDRSRVENTKPKARAALAALAAPVLLNIEAAAAHTEPEDVKPVSGAPASGAVADVADWMSEARSLSSPPADVARPDVSADDLLGQVEARELTDRIKASVRELLPMIIEAFFRRADLALGYGSWTDYCDAELAGMRMPVSDRQSATRALKQVGMSNRAIAGALGTSEPTVRRDLGDAPASDDARVVRGLDGKEYTAKPKPKREPAPPRDVPVRVVKPAPVPPPVIPTETGTCAHCGWAIGRRLDVQGAQWIHNAYGTVQCGPGHPGTVADPVIVIEGEAVETGTAKVDEPATPAVETDVMLRYSKVAGWIVGAPGGAPFATTGEDIAEANVEAAQLWAGDETLTAHGVQVIRWAESTDRDGAWMAVFATAEPPSTVDLGDDPDGDIEGSDQGSVSEAEAGQLAATPHPGSGALAVLRRWLESEEAELLLDTDATAVAAAMGELPSFQDEELIDRIDKITSWLGDVRDRYLLAG